MKTLIIYNDIITPIKYLVVDGDYSRFNGVMVNSTQSAEFADEFCDWMFDPITGKEIHSGWTESVSIIENKEWDKVAVCTYLP